MRIGDAFFQNKKISVLPSESRLLLFFAPPKVEKKVTPLLPLLPRHEKGREDAACRQMRRAIRENGFMPSPFYFQYPWGAQVLADGAGDMDWIWGPQEKRKPGNYARFFRALQFLRAGRVMEAEWELQEVLPFSGIQRYLDGMHDWIWEHRSFLCRNGVNFCWNQLWDSQDPRLVQFSLWYLCFYRSSHEEYLRKIVPFLSQCGAFTVQCLCIISEWEDAQDLIFKIAQYSKDYARYAAVRYLNPETPGAQDWLIRQAPKDTRMPMDFALLCAQKGDLDGRLAQDQISREDFSGAGKLLARLIPGDAPYRNICDLQGSAVVMKNYLRHAKIHAKTLEDFNVVSDIYWTTQRYTYQNHELEEEVRSASLALMKSPRCLALLEPAMVEGSPAAYDIARQIGMPYQRRAMRQIQLNFWQNYRLADFLLPEHYAEEILALFEQRLPVQMLRYHKRRPKRSQIEQEWMSRTNAALGYILGKLQNLPGKGEKLLLGGIRSTYAEHREQALAALEKWEKIPQKLRLLLRQAERYGYHLPGEKERRHRLRVLARLEEPAPKEESPEKQEQGE
jgi:hypothetical protein